MAAQAPDSAAAGITNDYLMAWAAITRLLTRGGSLSGREPNTCFLNLGEDARGNVRFADVSGAAHFDFLDDARALALTDWDFDGDLDVWVLNRSAPQLRLLKNSKADSGHFIAFRLDAPEGNRDALGARVEVELKGDAARRITRAKTVVAGSGFLSQSTRWLHFGLGVGDPQIVAARVHWPDGSEQVAHQITADQFYHWTQGKQPHSWNPPTSHPQPVDTEVAGLTPTEDTAAARVVLSARPVLPRVHDRLDRISRPTLVSLWASWCHPCLAELQDWWAQRERFAEHRLDVLTLNVDQPDKNVSASQKAMARTTLNQIDVGFSDYVLPAESAAVLDLFQQSQMALQTPLALPTSLLVDRDGRVAVIYKGGVTVDQILDDLALLDIEEDERADRAAAFPGRWYRLPRGEDATRVAARLQDDGMTRAAIDYLETAIEGVQRGDGSRRARPLPDLWFTLARLRIKVGDQQAALKAYRQTLTLESRHVGANKECGKLLFDMGQWAEAKPLLETAIDLDARAIGSLNLLALTELQLGQPSRAIRLAERSVETAPNQASATFTLGLSYQQVGRWRDALDAYRTTIELNPAWHVARNNMAWILSTAPEPSVRDGRLALQLVQPLAERQSHDRPLFLRTLAAAHAEMANFDRAAQIVRQTLNQLGAKPHPLRTQLQADLRRYEAGEPIRS